MIVPSGPSENESEDTFSSGSSQNDSDEVSGPSPGSRKEAKRKELYLRGGARKSYHISKELQSSFEETGDLPGTFSLVTGMLKYARVVPPYFVSIMTLLRG